jgi:hypothetical protein
MRERYGMANWGTDYLTQFLERVYDNQRGNHQKFAGPYVIIVMLPSAGIILETPMAPTGVLFLRSQYAYKTAAGMTLAGQATETFVMLRSCLEYAGYALAMFA